MLSVSQEWKKKSVEICLSVVRESENSFQFPPNSFTSEFPHEWPTFILFIIACIGKGANYFLELS